MKMQVIGCLLSVGLVFTPLATGAQRKSSELIAIAERLVRSFEQNKPTWTHEEGTPIEGSFDVAIHRWVSEDIRVRVTIVRYSSVEKAQEGIGEFAHSMRSTNAAHEDADEAYSIAGRSNSIVIRKANYLIYVEVNCKNPADESDLMKQVRKLIPSAEIFRRGDSAAVAVPARQRNTPNFAGSSIPESPRQKTPWTPPQTQLPANLISATTRLFEQGLADPRGMEYREIEVVIASGWRKGVMATTHGWILPGATTSQRFAVCWNGLVYPVVSIGNQADPRTDVETAIKSDEEVRTEWANTRSTPFYRSHGATSEAYSISATNLLPLKVCLLLRLGKTDLAEKVWATWIAGMDAKTNNDSLHLADPYLMLAIDWTWAMYARAVNAHVRGDDRMCLISAVKAEAIAKSIRQEIPARPVLRGRSSSEYFDFLKPLPLLIEDQKRRAKHPRTNIPRDAAVLRQQPTAQLIDYLDEALAIQMGIPGALDMNDDPVVAELIKRGKAAVDPLLAALENDTRLTRSVRSSRPWHSDRHFITVYETALQAVRRILSIGNTDFEDWETIEKGIEGRRAVAARLRALAHP